MSRRSVQRPTQIPSLGHVAGKNGIRRVLKSIRTKPKRTKLEGFRSFVYSCVRKTFAIMAIGLVTAAAFYPNEQIGDAQYPELSMTVDQIEAVFENRLQKKIRDKARDLAIHLTWLSAHYKFDPAVILSVIHTESSFRTDAVSSVGALGLMQILPTTAVYFAKKEGLRFPKLDLTNPFVNITLGVGYLNYLRNRFQKTQRYLAAYNLGPTTVGKMVARNRFKLGKVKKYVTKIQSRTEDFRQAGIQLAASKAGTAGPIQKRLAL